MRTNIGRFVVLALSFAAACEGTAGGSGDEGGGPGGGSAGDDNGGTCEPNDGDGRTSCQFEECLPDEFCDVTDSCAVGCLSSINCRPGEYCDLRMPTSNWDNTLEVGTCRVPGAECGAGEGGPGTSSDSSADTTSGPAETTGGTPACDEVQGNYQMKLDSDVPEMCGAAFSGLTMCSVAQEGCNLTWGCDADFGINFPPGPIDGRIYEGTGSYMGVPFECTMEWIYSVNFTFTFSCSASLGGAAIVCTGTGA